jgi:hypothetical protein
MSLAPYHADDMVAVHVGDCRKVLAEMADASVDAICCDPPYELAFMGRGWDASGVAFDPVTWRECLRVLKPGGHLLAFGGTRTWHRLAVAIEDAGFEIRDSIHWLYGSGFPKGQDIGKSIERHRGDRPEVLRVTAFLAAARAAAGMTHRQIDEAFGFNGMASHWTAIAGKAATVPTLEQWERLRGLLGFGAEMDQVVAELNGRKGEKGEAWAQREVIGERHSGLANGGASIFLSGTTHYPGGMVPVTAAASDDARRWEGWNTSLKPGHEPIVLARKSTGFNSTVANVLEYGTGALNIDGCRIATDEVGAPRNDRSRDGAPDWRMPGGSSGNGASSPLGRWPTNLIFSHSASCVEGGPCEPDCPVRELDRQSGTLKSGVLAPHHNAKPSSNNSMSGGNYAGRIKGTFGGDQGGASRFFPTFRYEAKAPASERPKLDDGTAHSTVKPLALLRWLVRLITPPGGTVLDPFAGSGTTGEACVLEGFQSVLIELEQPHAELIKQRLSKPLQPSLDLFGEVTA